MNQVINKLAKTQTFKWTQEIINEFINRTGEKIEKNMALRQKLKKIRKDGVDKEQAIWQEIKKI